MSFSCPYPFHIYSFPTLYLHPAPIITAPTPHSQYESEIDKTEVIDEDVRAALTQQRLENERIGERRNSSAKKQLIVQFDLTANEPASGPAPSGPASSGLVPSSLAPSSNKDTPQAISAKPSVVKPSVGDVDLIMEGLQDQQMDKCLESDNSNVSDGNGSDSSDCDGSDRDDSDRDGSDQVGSDRDSIVRDGQSSSVPIVIDSSMNDGDVATTMKVLRDLGE